MSGMHQTWGDCPHCAARRMIQRPRTNHVLHFLLTLATCGLWLCVWAAVDLAKNIGLRPWRCAVCGTVTQPEGKRPFIESWNAFWASLGKGWRATGTPKAPPPAVKQHLGFKEIIGPLFPDGSRSPNAKGKENEPKE